jgi:hypothetical protein
LVEYSRNNLGEGSSHDFAQSLFKSSDSKGGEEDMNYTVLGIFEDRDNVEEALLELDRNGYKGRDISIVMKDTKEGEEVAMSTGAKVTGGAATGATTGALIGGIAGLVASYMIPGLGAFFIGGPLAAALGLTGAAATTVSGAATGALAGGLLGALTGLGLSEEDARLYESRVKEGAILIAVPARTDEERDVEVILENYGAESIKSVAMPEETTRRVGRAHYVEQDASRHAYVGIKGGKGERVTRK